VDLRRWRERKASTPSGSSPICFQGLDHFTFSSLPLPFLPTLSSRALFETES